MKTPTQPFCRRPHWRARLGDWGMLVIFIGSVLIVASCSIPLHLWIGTRMAAEGDEPSSFWRTLTERDSAPQVVIACAAAIRTSMLLQIGVITPALAAIMLEVSGTGVSDAAAVSLQRDSRSSSLEPITSSACRGTSPRVVFVVLLADCRAEHARYPRCCARHEQQRTEEVD